MMNKVVEKYSSSVEVVTMKILFHYLYKSLLLKSIRIMVDQLQILFVVLLDKSIHNHYLEEVLLKKRDDTGKMKGINVRGGRATEGIEER